MCKRLIIQFRCYGCFLTRASCCMKYLKAHCLNILAIYVFSSFMSRSAFPKYIVFGLRHSWIRFLGDPSPVLWTSRPSSIIAINGPTGYSTGWELSMSLPPADFIDGTVIQERVKTRPTFSLGSSLPIIFTGEKQL